MTDLLRTLDAYYQEAGIHARDFHCKHKPECDPATEATASLIGEFYESAPNRSIPRIVFVSLDPGRMSAKDDRTIEGERIKERGIQHDELKRGLHWHETHELAMALLQPWVPDIRFDTVCRYFAHTRVVRCSANRRGKAQAPKVMFRNCREYLRRELEILEPDVIVSQGAAARNAVNAIVTDVKMVAKECRCRVAALSGHEVLVISMHHPSPRARRYYKPQKAKCLDPWLGAVREFMNVSRRYVRSESP